MKGLSVIIATCNTKEITLRCIVALINLLQRNLIPYEVIIVDNNSSDGTKEALSLLKNTHLKLIFNSENRGYGRANNQGLHQASHEYILFLNSDVIVDPNIDFKVLLSYFDTHKNMGALTVKVELSDGSIDPASHRGFPTVWRSLCYFLGLERLFYHVPHLNKWFGGYHLSHLDLKTVHEIDSPTGAFFLAPRSLLVQLQGFDEDFFMYGEDLDLSFRMKEKGFKIVYYPLYKVVHLKYQSGLKHKNEEAIRRKIRTHFYDAMIIFYRKHYAQLYPQVINNTVYWFIDLKKKLI